MFTKSKRMYFRRKTMNPILKKLTALLLVIATVFSFTALPIWADEADTVNPETTLTETPDGETDVIPPEDATEAEETEDAVDATELTRSHLDTPLDFGYVYRYHNGYDIPTVSAIVGFFERINKITKIFFGFKVFNSEKLQFTAEGFVDEIFNDMAECSFFDGYAVAQNFPMPNKSAQAIIDLFDIDVPATAAELETKIREHRANGETFKELALMFVQAYLKQIKSIHMSEKQINDTTYQFVCDMTYKYGGTETYDLDLYYDAENQVYYGKNQQGLFDLGFDYNVKEQVLYGTVNSWQKQFGFRLLYDFVANIIVMDYNTERVKFTYNDKEWMIQFWKGRYVVAPGGEVGIYNRAIGSKGSYYDCAVNDTMTMSIELYHEEELIFKNGPMNHWWITGFYIGNKFYLPESLTMKGIIEFPSEEMATVFTQAAQSHKRLTIEQNGATVNYTFGSYINL